MPRRHIIPAFLLALLAAGAVRAQEPAITVRAEPQSVALGDSVELLVQVEVHGMEQPEIQLPPLGDFDVLSRSMSTPMQFSFSLGAGTKVSRTTQYSFTLAPRKVGDLTIAPVVVAYAGKKYQSRPLVIHVLGSPSQGRGQGGPSPGVPGPEDVEPQTPSEIKGGDLKGARLDEQLFVQTVVSKEKAYLGESLTLGLYLYTGVQLSDVNVKREPGTDDFWSESLMTPQSKISFEDVVVGGRLFQRALLRHVSLSALKPGRLTIAPAVVEGMMGVGMFFSRQKVITRVGVPITIDVLPLPQEGRPVDFPTGNVGTFEVKAQVSADQVKVGDPVTLRIDINGEGNLRAVKLNVWKELDGFRVYEPQVTDSSAVQNGVLIGRRTYEVLLIPEREGILGIPSLQMPYFDPRASQYRTATTPEFSVRVSPGAGTAAVEPRPAPGAATPALQAPEEERGKDSLSLRSIVSKADLRASRGEPLYRTWWYLSALVVPPVLLFFLWFGGWIRERRREVGSQTKWRRAAGTAIRRIREAGNLRETSPEGFFGAMSRSLSGYLEDRMEIPLGGCTTSQIRKIMERNGYPEDLVERVFRELEVMDFARFSSGGSAPPEIDSCLRRVEDLLRALDRIQPKRGQGERTP